MVCIVVAYAESQRQTVPASEHRYNDALTGTDVQDARIQIQGTAGKHGEVMHLFFATACDQPPFRPLSRAGCSALGMLVGNTRELWDTFVDACRNDSALMELEDPLDTYVTRVITQAAQQLPSPPTRIYWSHKPATDLAGGAPFVAMQRLAAAIGMAYLDEASHLCLHPKHGPWFSMRAVLLWDDIVYSGMSAISTSLDISPVINHPSITPEPCPPPLPNTLSRKTEQYVRFVARCARNSLTGCDLSPLGSPTSAAFYRAASTGSLSLNGPHNNNNNNNGQSTLLPSSSTSSVGSEEEVPTAEAVRTSWEKWVAVRDAPCPGHPRRFSRDQLEYHYTHNKAALQRAVDGVGPQGRACEPLRIVTRVSSSTKVPWVMVWSA